MRPAALVIAAVVCGALLVVAAPALSSRPYVPAAVDFELRVPAAGKARAAGGTWTSPVLRPGKRFDVFGLRWRRATGHLDIHVRVREDGVWRRWVDVGDSHSAKGSDPVWAGGADALQLRMARRPAGLRVHFVNTSGTATAADRARTAIRRAVHAAFAAAAGPVARAANGQPAIVPRSEWAGSQCPPRDTPERGTVQAAFVHHTVTANDYGPQDSRSMVLGICRFHRNGNGWDDIGYNFLVDKYGAIFEGRAGGIDQPVVGAQAQGYNDQSTGIANLGTYQDVPQTDAALDAMARLIAWKLPLHGAPVDGTVTLTSKGGSSNRYPSGRAVTFQRISGHRDGNSTECPGRALYAQLPRLRQLAAGHAPAVTGYSPGSLTATLTARAFAFPEPIRLTGRLTDPSGAAVAGRAVRVQIATSKGWRGVTTATTAEDGGWTAEIRATRSWTVRAVAGTLRSPRVRAVVSPAVSARAAAPRVRAGRRAVVTGSLRPSKSPVFVEAARQVGTRFVRAVVLRARTRKGRFRAAVPLRRAGLYRVRVSFRGDRRHGPARAADLYVRATRGPTGGTAARAGR